MSDITNYRMLNFYETATPAQRAFEGELARLYFTDDYMDEKVAGASRDGDFSTKNGQRDTEDSLADNIEPALKGELKVVKKGAMWVYGSAAREGKVSSDNTNEAQSPKSNIKRKRREGDDSEAPGDVTRASKAARLSTLCS